MKTFFTALLFSLSLCACSTSPGSAPADRAEAYSGLSEESAESQLSQVNADIEELDKEIRGAESRLNAARIRQGQDASRNDAVEGAEAELGELREQKGRLLQRQIWLERRIRELQSGI